MPDSYKEILRSTARIRKALEKAHAGEEAMTAMGYTDTEMTDLNIAFSTGVTELTKPQREMMNRFFSKVQDVYLKRRDAGPDGGMAAYAKIQKYVESMKISSDDSEDLGLVCKKDVDGMQEYCRKTGAIVTIRDTGKDSLERLHAGALPKPHSCHGKGPDDRPLHLEMLEKSIKPGSLKDRFIAGFEGTPEERYEEAQRLGINGLVGAWETQEVDGKKVQVLAGVRIRPDFETWCTDAGKLSTLRGLIKPDNRDESFEAAKLRKGVLEGELELLRPQVPLLEQQVKETETRLLNQRKLLQRREDLVVKSDVDNAFIRNKRQIIAQDEQQLPILKQDLQARKGDIKRKEGELKGCNPGNYLRIWAEPAQVETLKALFPDNWAELCYTGDYDMGDVLVPSSGGSFGMRPALDRDVTPDGEPSGRREGTASHGDKLNEAMGFTSEDKDERRIQHGGQRGFTAFLGEHKDDTRVHVVAEPAHEILAITPDGPVSIRNAMDYAMFYAATGASPQQLLSDGRLDHYGWAPVELPDYVTADEGSCTIRVRIIPDAEATGVAGVDGKDLKLKVAAPIDDVGLDDRVTSFLAGKIGIAESGVAVERSRGARRLLRVSSSAAAVAKALS